VKKVSSREDATPRDPDQIGLELAFSGMDAMRSVPEDFL
jgi:hypothetical protein